MLKKLLISIALCLCPSVALADALPANYTPVSSTVAVTARVGPGVFYGIQTLATQATLVTCYDNTAASGSIIFQSTPAANTTGVPATAVPGFAVINGITCVIATSIVAPGFLILWK
jgi:hypothetical protein